MRIIIVVEKVISLTAVCTSRMWNTFWVHCVGEYLCFWFLNSYLLDVSKGDEPEKSKIRQNLCNSLILFFNLTDKTRLLLSVLFSVGHLVSILFFFVFLKVAIIIFVARHSANVIQQITFWKLAVSNTLLYWWPVTVLRPFTASSLTFSSLISEYNIGSARKYRQRK